MKEKIISDTIRCLECGFEQAMQFKRRIRIRIDDERGFLRVLPLLSVTIPFDRAIFSTLGAI